MRVGIIGAGALGSVIGGLLTEAGVDTVLFERDAEETRMISDSGLWMEGVSGDRTIKLNMATDPNSVPKRDLVMIVVKAYDTASTLDLCRKIIADDGVALTLQNGLGAYDILSDALPGKVLLGTTTIGAMSLGKARTRHTGFGQTHLGEPDGTMTERVHKVAETLKRMNSGPVEVTDNAFGSIWSKLIVNAAINAPATLLRLRNGDLPTGAAGRELIHSIVQECLSITKRLGIQLLLDDAEAHVLKVCAGTAPNLSSMYQDVLAGRRTEIDFINGALVREARKLGIDAPVNSTLTLLIQTLEATAAVRGPE